LLVFTGRDLSRPPIRAGHAAASRDPRGRWATLTVAQIAAESRLWTGASSSGPNQAGRGRRPGLRQARKRSKRLSSCSSMHDLVTVPNIRTSSMRMTSSSSVTTGTNCGSGARRAPRNARSDRGRAAARRSVVARRSLRLQVLVPFGQSAFAGLERVCHDYGWRTPLKAGRLAATGDRQ
jgi:hypothetical protein